MLNQTFSLSNFEEIYDEDNRKGRNQDDLFFPDVSSSSQRLSAKARALKAFKKRNSSYKKYPKAIQRRYDILFKNLKKQRDDREAKITNALTVVTQKANKKSFRIGITKKDDYSKPVYEKDKTPESYYALRQITRNIRRLYKTKPADRNLIISQVQNLLQDNFPYTIIRTDISSFFESVNHDILLSKLSRDQLLSTNSIKLIKQILWDYSILAKSQGCGIPRGLGVSSDLAELFLKPIDRGIREIKGVVFYARYVDDIFILVSPSLIEDSSAYLPQVRHLIEGSGLKLNEDKTIEIKKRENSKKFEYLGYEFTIKKSFVAIDITKSKFDRFERRINNSFKAYEKHRHRNAKGAYRLILKRIKFLTSNTRLVNSKGNAFVGIYFGNCNLNKYDRLSKLDEVLKSQIDKVESKTLKDKLKNLSFVKGHKERTYSKFNRHLGRNRKDEFSQIVEAWRYEK